MRKIGSNQYKTKRKTNMHYLGYYFFSVAVIIAIAIPFRIKSIEKAYANQVIVSPLPIEKPVESSSSAKLDPTKEELAEKIDAYIKTIFGKDWRVARAIYHNECSPSHKDFPYKCRYTTSKEDSIGLFQINLKSKTTKIHWDRIPGETEEEKVTWLSDPFNNVLMAYWIYTKSGWNPWSAYTSNRYLKDL